MKRIAILTARGGSKRIPRKNIKNFLGRPMISYPVSILKQSGLFESVIVSTDDEEIAEVALEWGAEVPFIRPSELADDYTGTEAVITHALEWLIKHGQRPDYFCCVYPTAPFLSAKYLEQGWTRLQEGKSYAFSVTSFPFPFQRSLRLLNGGGVEPFFPEYMPCRSQDLEPAYHDAGQFYWWNTKAFFDDRTGISENTSAIVLPRHLVQDIDDEEDWFRAELMYRAMQLEGVQS